MSEDCAQFEDKDIETLRAEWKEDNAEDLQRLSGKIQASITLFNNKLEEDNGIGPAKVGYFNIHGGNPATIASPSSFTIGGSDGLGYFGEDGALGKKKKEIRNNLDGIINKITGDYDDVAIAAAEELKEIIKDSNFYDFDFTAWKQLAAFEKCKQDAAVAEEVSQGTIAKYWDDVFGGFEEVQAAQNLASADVLLTDIVGEIADPTYEFKEQCFLLTHIFNLAKIKEKIDHGESSITDAGGNAPGQKVLPDVIARKNRTVLATGEPFSFMNRLTQSPSKDLFFEMTNEQISTLQPMIRLFKVIENTEKEGECQEEKEVEFIFDTYDREEDISRMFSTNGVRGIGVGLKSFNFAYEADNPFAIKKSISAKLTIFANSFSELLHQRTNSTEPYSYIDLALKTGGSETIKLSRSQSSVAAENLDKLNFRLKAVVGWQVPITSRGIFSQALIDALYDSAISINLTPTVHEFNIDDNGRVTFTINYLAYAEDYFDNSNFNIFTKKEVFDSQIKRSLKVQKLSEACDEGAQEKYNEFKNSDTILEEIKEEKSESLKYLIESLIATGKVYLIPMEEEDIKLYRIGGVYSAASNLYDEAAIEGKIKALVPTEPENALEETAGEGEEASGEREEISQQVEAATEDIQASDTSTDPATDLGDVSPATISFFYASDLIDIILKNIGESLTYINDLQPEAGQFTEAGLAEKKKKYARLKENYNKLRILLGPLEISKPNSYETTVINLGDIAISVKNFLEFLTTKMLAKEQAEYFLTGFLNHFFNEFIVNLLNRDACYDGRGAQKLFLHEAAITEFRNSSQSQDSVTRHTINCGKKRLYLDNTNGAGACSAPMPLLNVMGIRNDPRTNPGLCKEMNYLSFYAGRSIPMNQVIGCKNATDGPNGVGCYNENNEKVSDVGDHSRGIWHYQIGKDRGIVKTINLSKTDSTGLAEVRFEQEGYDGLRQLRVLYDVSIKSYLDVSAFPGSYIYVEPRGFDIKAQTADGFDLTQLGIGGYHMIVKSEHTIQPGLAETTISAKWVAARDASTVVDLNKYDANAPTKCGSTGN